MALREYQLTNFKAFAGPETIPIRPITLIYGPNSSGKSSILQSLLLLKQTLEEADSSTPLLPKGKLVDLGDYREFIHRHDVNKQFSFQATFVPDVEEAEPVWVKEILKAIDSALVGLKVVFKHDEKTKMVGFFSAEVFIGDKSLPAISYSRIGRLKKGSDFVARTEVHPESGFWPTWLEGMKHYIEEQLKDIDRISYKEGDSEKELRHDLGNYSFEEAMRDLWWKNVFSYVGCQNFLPAKQSSPPAEYEKRLVEGLKQLDEELEQSEALREEAAQPQQSQSSSPADSLRKRTAGEGSPFAATIFYPSDYGREPFEQGLDVLPFTLQVCSAFRQLVEEMVYLGPLRSNPERYYTFSGNLSEQVGQFGERMPDVLFRNREVLERINAEFDRFQLRYELKLSELKDEDSNLSNVFALRLVDKGTSVSASIRDVGFGASQVLPIIVQSLLSQNKTLLIEQPEIHLHPALQSELGDLFIKSALGEQKNTFILETHSEHLMLRILRRIRETTEGELEPGLTPIRPEDVAVLYVLPGKDSAKVIEIPIRPDGEFAKRWPQGFFTDRAKELF